MKKILTNEKGFTLVELLVVIAILGIIMGAMSMTANIIYQNIEKARGVTIVTRNLEYAAYNVTRDIQDSTNNITSPSNFSSTLVLNCWIWEGNNMTQQNVSYSINPTNGDMTRQIGNGPWVLVAQGIESQASLTNITNIAGTYKYEFNVTASFHNVSENATYTVERRLR